MNMKLLVSAFMIAFMILAVNGQKTSPKSKLVNVKFTESDSLFSNPGQGWLNSKRFPSTDRYVRVNWVELEPERGKYDWSVFDNVIEAGKQNGSGISIRVMTCNPHSKTYYASPKWLFDEGCKSFEYLLGGTGDMSAGIRIPRIEPDYSDSIFLLRHNEFIQALGKKYNGSPYVDYVDIGTYGHWGEWHTPHAVSIEVRKKIADMYIKAFPDTRLVFLHGDEDVLPYALSFGTGTRRDGIGSPWDAKDYKSAKYTKIQELPDAWKKAPVVFEWYGPFEWMAEKGWSMDSAVNFMLRHHVTYVNDNLGKIPDDEKSIFDQLSKKAGARIVLNEISYPGTVRTGNRVPVTIRISNTGVGKLYNPYVFQLCLINDANEIVFSSDLQAASGEWLPGIHNIDGNMIITENIKRGEYKLAAGLIDAKGIRPPFRMAIDSPIVNGHHVIGKLMVK